MALTIARRNALTAVTDLLSIDKQTHAEQVRLKINKENDRTKLVSLAEKKATLLGNMSYAAFQTQTPKEGDTPGQENTENDKVTALLYPLNVMLAKVKAKTGLRNRFQQLRDKLALTAEESTADLAILKKDTIGVTVDETAKLLEMLSDSSAKKTDRMKAVEAYRENIGMKASAWRGFFRFIFGVVVATALSTLFIVAGAAIAGAISATLTPMIAINLVFAGVMTNWAIAVITSAAVLGSIIGIIAGTTIGKLKHPFVTESLLTVAQKEAAQKVSTVALTPAPAPPQVEKSARKTPAPFPQLSPRHSPPAARTSSSAAALLAPRPLPTPPALPTRTGENAEDIATNTTTPAATEPGPAAPSSSKPESPRRATKLTLVTLPEAQLYPPSVLKRRRERASQQQPITKKDGSVSTPPPPFVPLTTTLPSASPITGSSLPSLNAKVTTPQATEPVTEEPSQTSPTPPTAAKPPLPTRKPPSSSHSSSARRRRKQPKAPTSAAPKASTTKKEKPPITSETNNQATPPPAPPAPAAPPATPPPPPTSAPSTPAQNAADHKSPGKLIDDLRRATQGTKDGEQQENVETLTPATLLAQARNGKPAPSETRSATPPTGALQKAGSQRDIGDAFREAVPAIAPPNAVPLLVVDGATDADWDEEASEHERSSASPTTDSTADASASKPSGATSSDSASEGPSSPASKPHEPTPPRGSSSGSGNFGSQVNHFKPPTPSASPSGSRSPSPAAAAQPDFAEPNAASDDTLRLALEKRRLAFRIDASLNRNADLADSWVSSVGSGSVNSKASTLSPRGNAGESSGIPQSPTLSPRDFELM